MNKTQVNSSFTRPVSNCQTEMVFLLFWSSETIYINKARFEYWSMHLSYCMETEYSVKICSMLISFCVWGHKKAASKVTAVFWGVWCCLWMFSGLWLHCYKSTFFQNALDSSSKHKQFPLSLFSTAAIDNKIFAMNSSFGSACFLEWGAK